MRVNDNDAIVIYVNPEDIEDPLPQEMKKDILASEEPRLFGRLAKHRVFEDTKRTRFRDILAQARTDGLTGTFFISNRASAEKGAVLAVEATHPCGEKGIENRYSSLASTRRFYLDPKMANGMACNLNMAGNTEWEQWARCVVGRDGVLRSLQPVPPE